MSTTKVGGRTSPLRQFDRVNSYGKVALLMAFMMLLALCIGLLPEQAHAWTGPVKGIDKTATVQTAVM